MATEFKLTPMPKDRPKRWRKIDDRLPDLGKSHVWYCISFINNYSNFVGELLSGSFRRVL